MIGFQSGLLSFSEHGGDKSDRVPPVWNLIVLNDIKLNAKYSFRQYYDTLKLQSFPKQVFGQSGSNDTEYFACDQQSAFWNCCVQNGNRLTGNTMKDHRLIRNHFVS